MNQDIVDEIRDQDYSSIAESLADFISGSVEKSGAEGVILGLSGGIDSAALAYICKNALKEKTTALVMPDTSVTPESETKDALRTVSLTGIQYKLIDIKPIVDEYSMYLEPDEKAKGNLRARVRTDILYYYANAKNYLVLGSSDRSEHLLGYFTKFGDGAADIAPIISLYKLQTRELARHLGVPAEIVSKKSGPHLWKDHDAEGEIGAPYEEIDSVLYCMNEKGLSAEETSDAAGIEIATVRRILWLHASSGHKRLQAQGPGRDRA